ncbi:MAG: HAMP domain-containing sensor histidine kinase [Spirochaetota bacterium]|nr:HAMP domain-containing sensor histidine kinase [Spirochaetota bacterium]
MRRSRKRLMIGDGREGVFVISSLIFGFLLLLGLLVFLTSALYEREELRLQNEAERAFNSVFLALQDSNAKALRTMAEENVSGVGVYSSMGRKVMSLGKVPMTIPAELFTTRDGFVRTGRATYNKATQMVEYIRFSRLTILLETGQLTLTEQGLLPTPIDFPDLLYLSLDGSAYHHRLMVIVVLGFFSGFVIIGLFIAVLTIYLKNRSYRQTLAKQESLVNLGQAARTLAHEIKNPLSAVTIQVALLKKTLSEEHKEDLQVIEGEVNRLTQLTNKISDFLRNPLGQPEVVNVDEFFEMLIKAFDMPIAYTSERPLSILIDPDRMRSIFENILKNAVESNEGEDAQVEVAVSTGKKHVIHIIVKDRGVGIKKSDMKKIFDPFYTTKIQGSGIGLSISQQFVRARGGSISLRGREGGGTIVEVILPEAIRPLRKHKESEG